MTDRPTFHDWLIYDCETGFFTWRVRPAYRCYVGERAGHLNKQGYWEIELRGRVYQAHRVAWLMVYGVWPSIFIDHINGVRSDNRIANLRLATRRQNVGNRKRNINNVSGFKGVRIDSRNGKWQARCRQRHLGYFTTALEAHEAYVRAAKDYFGEFARGS